MRVPGSRPRGIPPGSPSNNPKGRPKGSKNRDVAAIWEMLDRLKCDPLEGLAQIAVDPTTDRKLRARCYADLAQYVYAKRANVQVTDADGNSLPQIVITLPDNGRGA